MNCLAIASPVRGSKPADTPEQSNGEASASNTFQRGTYWVVLRCCGNLAQPALKHRMLQYNITPWTSFDQTI